MDHPPLLKRTILVFVSLIFAATLYLLKEPSALDVSISSSTLQTCQLTIEDVNSSTVSLKYSGLSGNQPNDYQNFVAIWDSSSIPWNAPPLARDTIPVNAQSGSYTMGGLAITNSDYIVGYAVGNDITDICVAAPIAALSLELATPSDRVYISIASISTTSVLVNYFTLPGYLPKTYNNWIGLWEGFASPYNAPRPLSKVRVKSNANQGTVLVDDINLTVGQTYTLVYFMGLDGGKGWPRVLSNAAAILNFQLSQTDE